MAEELVFYTHPQSRGRMARWMLEEVGQPYRTELLDYATTMKAPAYRAINPMGKVPALKHGDAVVTEVAARYTRRATLQTIDGSLLPIKDWVRGEWLRSGLPMYLSNEACGLANAATRKYLTMCWRWYFPPP